jgi:4-diphosphocytidyl-2-C-methyl-D-erythritol kinase
VPAAPDQTETVRITLSGIPIVGNATDNLCVKAWHLLQQHFPTLPKVQMHVHKHIPMGAGMGGGSSDGSYMLQLLAQQFNLPATPALLDKLALELGSDCPFFLTNTPSFAKGRGEQLIPVEVPLKDYWVLLLHPGIAISTAQAFAQIQPRPVTESLPQMIQYPIAEWKNRIHNQFEDTVFKAHPSLLDYKQQLYKLGALYASLTGSGSTLYGIFPPESAMPETSALLVDTHWVKILP